MSVTTAGVDGCCWSVFSLSFSGDRKQQQQQQQSSPLCLFEHYLRWRDVLQLKWWTCFRRLGTQHWLFFFFFIRASVVDDVYQVTIRTSLGAGAAERSDGSHQHDKGHERSDGYADDHGHRERFCVETDTVVMIRNQITKSMTWAFMTDQTTNDWHLWLGEGDVILFIVRLESESIRLAIGRA